MENKQLSKSAQIVQDALSKKGISCTVIELPSSTRTAQEAADSLGCQISQIIKSLVFKTKETNRPILVLASGSNRVNEALIERELNEKIVRADAEFTRETTGFAIGGIPPLAHKNPIQTFIDKDLLRFDELWAAAGTPDAVFKLQSNCLQALTDGKIIQIQ
jgi:prolyl-tRNA editing enzyme YbaK/EbsC (Cys-tRNA(Pro) deacylase)